MNINEFIADKELLSEAKIYIVGAGRYGKILGKYLEKKEISWEGYIDRNSALRQVNGKKVISYQEINGEKAYYIISSFLYKDDLLQELRKHAVLEEQIITYENQEDFYNIYEDLVHWKKYTEKLKSFKGKYRDKRCFVIGNGPSLRISDLEQLKDEITFASNSIYAIYEKTVWRPTFHCAWDDVFCKQMMSDQKDMERLTSKCEFFFTSIVSEGFQYRDCKEIDNLFYVKGKKLVDEKTGLPIFSEECSEQVYLSATIAYLMLQLAVYMGFHEIYLLGIDAYFSTERHKDGKVIVKNVKNHQTLIEKEEERFGETIMQGYGYSYVAEIDSQMEAYQSAKQYADTHGIKIYNATRGGKLEIFERVDFDSLFH